MTRSRGRPGGGIRPCRRGTGLRSALLALVLALPVLGVPAPAQAQQGPPGRGDRPALEREIRERFHAMVQRELGLDDASLAAMNGVLEELQEERRALNMRQRELRRELNSSATLLSEDQARDALDELIAVRADEVALMRRETDRLLAILSPPQLVRFYTLREQFADRVRQLRMRRPRG